MLNKIDYLKNIDILLKSKDFNALDRISNQNMEYIRNGHNVPGLSFIEVNQYIGLAIDMLEKGASYEEVKNLSLRRLIYED